MPAHRTGVGGGTRDEAWERHMDRERAQLRQRAHGQMARALGRPVPAETREEIDRIAEDDGREAQQGLVRLVREDGAGYPSTWTS